MIALEAQTDYQIEISRAKTLTWHFKQSDTVRHVNIEVKKVIMELCLLLTNSTTTFSTVQYREATPG